MNRPPNDTVTAPTHDWRQVPLESLSLGVTDYGSNGHLGLCIAAAAIGPALRAVLIPGGTWGLALIVTCVVVVASIALALLSDRLWPLRLVSILAAGAALWIPLGKFIALWVVAGLLISDWGMRRRPTIPRLPIPPANTLIPVLILSLATTFPGINQQASLLALVPLGIATALIVLSILAKSAFNSLNRTIEGLARWIATAVSFVAFSIVGLFVVAIPWLVQRTFRADPLTGRSGVAGWVNRQRMDPQPTQLWATEPARQPKQRFQWARTIAASVVTVLIVVALVTTLLREGAKSTIATIDETQFSVTFDVPPAMEGVDWYQEYMQDLRWITDDRVAWNLTDQYRFKDVETRFINIRDGHRVSWTAPLSDRKHLVAWIYGGSTTFGFDQRDNFTIASQLAKVAYDNGFDLDVVNRGVNGQTHFMEANRFAWDLTLEGPPDLVLFYDGVNELWTARQLNHLGFGNRREPLDPMTADLQQKLIDDALANSAGRVPSPPNGGRVLTKKVRESDDPKVLGQLAMAQYQRARLVSTASAKAYKIPIYYFWQPIRVARTERSDEPRPDKVSEVRLRLQSSATHELLPSDVIDLYHLFDHVDRPLFTDDSHHNEFGAHIVAKAIFDAIAPELKRLA